jgi:hypothetical protein
MKKNDYVQFTGKLPKELKGIKLPIFGKVEKKIGKFKVVVKPRYKRFEVSVAIIDLTEVDYDTYRGKALAKPKAKNTMKKVVPACVTKKDIKKNSGVTKVVKKAREELPAVKVAKSVTEKSAVATKTPSELAFSSTSTEPVKVKPPVIPVAEPTLKEADVPNTNWVKDEPVVDASTEQKYEAGIDPYAEYCNDNKSLPRSVIVLLLIAAATVAYFLLN